MSINTSLDLTDGSPESLRAYSTIAGKYRLESLLAQGGMGSVWIATQLDLERQVAIKVVHKDARDALASRRLLREAQAAGRIGHANIAQIYELGYVNGVEPFIVMELLKGEDLGARLLRSGRIAPAEVVRIIIPIASALAAAHANGIIHRDLKPANIFLAIDDSGNEVPKVVDFGVAKVSSFQPAPKLTISGRIVGSPAYLSPEQAMGEEQIDASSDIWALCATMYESITGRLPFFESNYNRLLRSIIETEPRPFSDYGLPDDGLWEIVARGLSKKREERWQSMAELGMALEGWLDPRGFDNVPRSRFAYVSRRSSNSNTNRFPSFRTPPSPQLSSPMTGNTPTGIPPLPAPSISPQRLMLPVVPSASAIPTTRTTPSGFMPATTPSAPSSASFDDPVVLAPPTLAVPFVHQVLPSPVPSTTPSVAIADPSGPVTRIEQGKVEPTVVGVSRSSARVRHLRVVRIAAVVIAAGLAIGMSIAVVLFKFSQPTDSAANISSVPVSNSPTLVTSPSESPQRETVSVTALVASPPSNEPSISPTKTPSDSLTVSVSAPEKPPERSSASKTKPARSAQPATHPSDQKTRPMPLPTSPNF